jgi:hypothetical protein
LVVDAVVHQVDYGLLLIAVGLGPQVAAKNAATCEQRIAAAQTYPRWLIDRHSFDHSHASGTIGVGQH